MKKQRRMTTSPLFSGFFDWLEGVLSSSKGRRSGGASASLRRYGMNPKLQAVVTIIAAIGLAGLLFSGVLLLEYTNHADLLAKGKQLMKEGKVAWAADNFKKIIEQDAGHYEAHLRLGQVLLELGETEQAEHEFETAMAIKLNIPPQRRTSQQDALVSIASAKLSMIKKNWAEAEQTLLFAYEKQPKNLELKEALWVLYQQWGQWAFQEKHVSVAISQWGHALDFVGRYQQEEETAAWLAKGLQIAYKELEEQKVSPIERLAFIETALRKQYSYKLLLTKAAIYEYELKKPDLALEAYRRAYQAQPQIVGLKLLERLDMASQQAELAGNRALVQALSTEAERVRQGLKQQQPAGQRIGVHIQRLERTAEDPETTEWEPRVVLVLRNDDAMTVPYLKLKVVLSSHGQLLSSLTQEVFPPLRAGEVRTVVIEPKQRYLMHKLHKGVLEAEVLMSLDEETPVTWVVKDKKQATLFPPAQWLNEWFPWELPKKPVKKESDKPDSAQNQPAILGTSIPNA